MSISVNCLHLWIGRMCTHIGNPKMRGRLGGEAAGIKRQFMSILYVNYCQLSPFVDWKNVQRTLAIQNERSVGRRSRGIKRQLMSILYVNYRQFVSICGLEECATHISNPKMRGCLGGGAAVLNDN